MQETQTKIIDGMEVSVSQLPARRAMKMFNRLGRVFGPALGKIMASSPDGLKTMNIGAMGDAVAMLFEKFTDSEQDFIMNELLATAVVDNKPLMPIFDTMMRGKTLTVYKLLAFALEVNYGDFLGGLGGLKNWATPMAQSPFAVSTTSNGQSGGLSSNV